MKTVLIVDDFENTLFIVDFTLKNKGYNVLKATSGEQALNFFDGRKIDLVITDYNMPGMNGMELVEHIKAMSEYSNVPILLLTTEIDETKKKKAIDAGIKAWIQKPFKLDKFVKVVERSIR